MAELTLTQSAAATVLGRGYLSSDHLSTATGLDPAIMISKNGGNFANPAAGASVMTEIEATGWYTFALGTADTDTIGPLIIRGTHATMDNIEVVYQVVAVGLIDGMIEYTEGGYRFTSVALEEAPDTTAADVWGYEGRELDTGMYMRGYTNAGYDVKADALNSTLPAGVGGNTTFIDATYDGMGDDWAVGYILIVPTTYRVYTVTDFDDTTDTFTVSRAMAAGDAEQAYLLFPDSSAGGAGGGASAADVWAYETRTLTALDEDDTTIDLDGVTIGTVTTVTNGVTLADDAITAGKFDESTAFPLTATDSGSTYLARTGADSDTLETLSDQVDAAALEATLTAIKGATWSATTDTLEKIRDKETDIETDTAEIGTAGAGLSDIPIVDANVTQIGGVAQSATDLKDLVDTGYNPVTHAVVGVEMVTELDGVALGDINAEVDTALNTAIPGSPTANSINQRVAAIDDLTQASGAGDLAAILTDTGTTIPAQITGLNNLSATQVWQYVIETLTAEQIMRVTLAVLANKASGGGTTSIPFRDYADTKNRVTMTVDANGNRSAVTVDAT